MVGKKNLKASVFPLSACFGLKKFCNSAVEVTQSQFTGNESGKPGLGTCQSLQTL